MQSFDAEVALGHYRTLQGIEDLHQAFKQFFMARLVREPVVGAALRKVETERQQKTAAAAEQAAATERALKAREEAAVERFKRDMAAKRVETPPHPLGNLAAASRDRAPNTGTPAPGGQEPTAPMSAHETRRRARLGAQEDARRHFNH